MFSKITVELAFLNNLQGPHFEKEIEFNDSIDYNKTQEDKKYRLEYYRGMHLSMYGTDKDSK